MSRWSVRADGDGWIATNDEGRSAVFSTQWEAVEFAQRQLQAEMAGKAC